MYTKRMTRSWDHIRSFYAVAETGSLSAASRVLALTQPTVGRHIDLLEDDLKVSLFKRSRDGMTLTDKGAELIEAAQRTMDGATQFERIATGLDEGISGTVRISAGEVFGVLFMPKLLGRFMEQHPGIQVELVVTNEASNLLRRDADVAVRHFRPKQQDVVARKITDLELGLFAHETYLARHPEPHSLSDLRNHIVAGYDRDTTIIEAAQQLGESFAASDFQFRSDNLLTHLEVIRAGMGMGFTHVGLATQWPGVERLLPDLKIPPLELWIACHSDVRLNRRVRIVMDFLAENLSDPYGLLTH